jgi:sterol desaturase/sphingolipid hydroxylase (fatty acid hydroxylase superfamily)
MKLSSRIREFAQWTAYPAVLVMALGVYYGLHDRGVSWAVSSLVAALVCGLSLITLLEWMLPCNTAWKPKWTEVRTDVVFMLLVQVALPKALTLLFSVSLLAWLQMQGWTASNYWPHDWPVWLQMLLMMVSADFLRYWLHRAAHEYLPLWKLHAVHHSVDKLYWVNVGRFHPLDKSLQFLCDALPFMLLGLSAEVLTLYFVVYSIKGFFQHSNVDVKLGWLNYLISGPELHRWHHSKTVRESNTNYGNNFIIWDIVFGTFYWPRDREVGELGLLNPDYPTGFLNQMKAPFVPGIEGSSCM